MFLISVFSHRCRAHECSLLARTYVFSHGPELTPWLGTISGLLINQLELVYYIYSQVLPSKRLNDTFIMGNSWNRCLSLRPLIDAHKITSMDLLRDNLGGHTHERRTAIYGFNLLVQCTTAIL